jgi:ankyrin repeat protein
MTSVDFLQAAGAGDVSSLAALLDTGCDPNVVHPTTGATALYNACFASQVEAIQLLLSRGADPNKRITYQSPVDGRIEKGVVALMVASSEAAVALLLQAGADPSVRDDDGRLVGAASSKVFDMLIRAGADVTARSSDGRSAADIVTQKLEWWQRFARAKNAEHQADLRQILALLQAGAP